VGKEGVGDKQPHRLGADLTQEMVEDRKRPKGGSKRHGEDFCSSPEEWTELETEGTKKKKGSRGEGESNKKNEKRANSKNFWVFLGPTGGRVAGKERPKPHAMRPAITLTIEMDEELPWVRRKKKRESEKDLGERQSWSILFKALHQDWSISSPHRFIAAYF